MRTISRSIRNVIFLLFFINNVSVAQNKIRFPVGSFQKNNRTIIGLGVGLRSDEKIHHVTTIGIHFELLGTGISALNRIPPPEILVDSISERVYGLNISPFGTLSQNIAISGLSLSVFPSSVNKVNGVFICPVLFSEAKEINGMQISFLASLADIVRGIQFAGVGNFVESKSIGLQIGGVNESASHDGVQISIYNKAGKMNGLQVSIFYNDAQRKSAGLQIALLVNRSDDYRGVQIGLINVAKKLKGFQMGLVNVSGRRILPFFNW